MKRPMVNVSAPERVGRVVVGSLAFLIGVVLLLSGGGFMAVVLEALLVLTGLDLLVTGALGHCPLYARLGRTTLTRRS